MNGQVVYFAKARDGAIKIGTTANLGVRKSSLTSGLPGGCDIICTVPGGYELESYFHEVFAPSRISGEWFSETADLSEMIAKIKKLGPGALPAGFKDRDARKIGTEHKPEFGARTRRLLKQAAAPAVIGEKVPSAIARSARRCGLSTARVRSLWYNKSCIATAEEFDMILIAACKHGDDLGAIRFEFEFLRDRLLLLGNSIERAVAVLLAEGAQGVSLGIAPKLAPEILGDEDVG